MAKWESFCLERKVSVCDPSVSDLGEYLRFLNENMRTGCSVGDYFSAMKKGLSKKGLEAASSSQVRQLLVAMVHNKPSLPKLPGEIWNADRILTYFLSLPPNRHLSHVQLSGKCVVMLMLASGRRKADLMGLDVQPQFMKRTDNCFYFTLNKLSKSNLNNKNDFMQFLEFHRFHPEPQICPYTTIVDYLLYVHNTVFPPPNHTRFFTTTTLNATPAHPETVRGWAWDVLKAAGIQGASVHSIRSAHSSKAVALGENIDSVMQRGWTKTSTFYQHYLRPVAAGGPPTTPQGVKIDSRNIFCPKKLLTPAAPVIPFSSEYVLSSDVFPLPFLRSELNNPDHSAVQTAKKSCVKKPIPPEVLANAEVDIAHALLHNTALGQPPSDDEWVPPDPQVTPKVIAKPIPHLHTSTETDIATASGDFDLVTVITDEHIPESPLPATQSSIANTKLQDVQISMDRAHLQKDHPLVEPSTTLCDISPTPPSKLKLSPGQHLTLRSRQLQCRTSQNFKPYPCKPRKVKPMVTVNTDKSQLAPPPPPVSTPPSAEPPHQPPVIPQLTFYTSAALVGHSQLRYLFPDLQLDRVVLFGKNYNYHYPVSEGFCINALVTHFVCLNVSPLQLAIIVPHDFQDNSPDCVAITINDFPFKARLF